MAAETTESKTEKSAAPSVASKAKGNLRTIEGSLAVAESVAHCDPGVVACFPITPSTHIAEDLNKLYTDGEVKSFVAVESEFSSISVIVGGSAAGSRVFTTTSSQGLALMHEVIFTASGMRLPLVMCVANRALSAPLNIWNDQQDSVSERDSGWLQLFCENAQEAADTIPQAYKIAEEILLPVMVCIDGFYITHTVEQIDVPSREMIKTFLPPYKPTLKLDTAKPISLGVYALPADYQGFREDLCQDAEKAKFLIQKAEKEWSDICGRSYGNGLWEEYRLEDADYVFFALGSVCGNAKEAVDELRQQGRKVGVFRLKAYRPFPGKELAERVKGKKAVAVFEKAVSPGSFAPLYSEVLAALYEAGANIPVSSFVGGLGGKDVTVKDIKDIFEKIASGKKLKEFV